MFWCCGFQLDGLSAGLAQAIWSMRRRQISFLVEHEKRFGSLFSSQTTYYPRFLVLLVSLAIVSWKRIVWKWRFRYTKVFVSCRLQARFAGKIFQDKPSTSLVYKHPSTIHLWCIKILLESMLSRLRFHGNRFIGFFLFFIVTIVIIIDFLGFQLIQVRHQVVTF